MIIIMGAIGSGKSEQTKRLADRLHCPRLSTSQLLRDNPTPERQARMQAGELVDDQEIIELLTDEFKKINAAKTEFLLDGAPRSITQAKWMLEKIRSGEIMLTAIIKLDVSKEVVISRLSKRGREDDKEEIILKRLSDYDSVTTPVVDFFRQNDIDVHEVDGEKDLDQVETAIKDILEKK